MQAPVTCTHSQSGHPKEGPQNRQNQGALGMAVLPWICMLRGVLLSIV